MNRYHVTAYYQDRTDYSPVAQELVVLAEDPQSALDAARETLRPLADQGHIAAFQFGERGAVRAGVVHIGDPYIPLHWPLVNRSAAPAGRARLTRGGERAIIRAGPQASA